MSKTHCPGRTSIDRPGDTSTEPLRHYTVKDDPQAPGGQLSFKEESTRKGAKLSSLDSLPVLQSRRDGPKPARGEAT